MSYTFVLLPDLNVTRNFGTCMLSSEIIIINEIIRFDNAINVHFLPSGQFVLTGPMLYD